MNAPWLKIGKFRAIVSPHFDFPDLVGALADIERLAAAPEASLLQAGRHKTVRLALPCNGREIKAVAKFFGRQPLLKDIWDRAHSSKAFRTFSAAEFLASAGIGTTPPVACLESWRGPRLVSSVFVSVYLDDILCFKDELVSLWRGRAPYSAFLDSMRRAATGIRALHDAGCRHGDLGNQNIFFRRKAIGGPFAEALFLDLNRSRFSSRPLTDSERARDLSRICLPKQFLLTFLGLYWNEEPTPAFLRDWRKWYRRFRLHSATRRFRHPLRELDYAMHPLKAPAQADYPPPDRQWVWNDSKSRPEPVTDKASVLAMLDRPYRKELERASRKLALRFEAGLSALLPARLDSPEPSEIVRRMIVGCDEADSRTPGGLEIKKVLVRVNESEGDAGADRKIAVAKELAARGCGVAFQITQLPRFAGGRTVEFADRVIDRFGGIPDWVSVGQGINSLEWGIRDAGDLKAFLDASEHFVKDKPARLYRAVSAAVESPVLQAGCGNILKLLGGNVRYCAVALAWRHGDGDLEEEVGRLRTLAAGSFYARQKIVVICDGQLDVAPEVLRRLSGIVGEICVKP